MIVVDPSVAEATLEEAEVLGVPVVELGDAGGDHLRVSCQGEPTIDLKVEELHQRWSTGLPRALGM